jgi:tetratricopeptide (TPR) repeat protein
MIRRFSAVLLCAALIGAITIAVAQTPPDSPRPAAPAMPPDRKAYTDATKLTDPDKKVEALEKFIADFPKSTTVSTAHQTIFDTLVKSHPEQKDKILVNAEKTLEKSQDFQRPFLYEQFARKLLDAGILLDEAEKLANKGLVAIDEEMLKQTKLRKAGSYAMLGRIFLKQGKLKEAEQNLQQAKEFNPKLVAASVGLAELYSKQGKEQLALDTYLNAAINGKLPAEDRKQFEALYSKSNKGSLAGLEEKLDAEYNKLYPTPIKVEHYKPSEKRSNRTVLAEVFTGAGCGPCVAADLGFDAMMERYKRD